MTGATSTGTDTSRISLPSSPSHPSIFSPLLNKLNQKYSTKSNARTPQPNSWVRINYFSHVLSVSTNFRRTTKFWKTKFVSLQRLPMYVIYCIWLQFQFPIDFSNECRQYRNIRIRYTSNYLRPEFKSMWFVKFLYIMSRYSPLYPLSPKTP
jgi:hypothetical protein